MLFRSQSPLSSRNGRPVPQAEEIRKQGEKDAEEIKREVDRKAHDEIITTAIEASKEILGREVSREDNEKVVNAFLEKMKEDHSEE